MPNPRQPGHKTLAAAVLLTAAVALAQTGKLTFEIASIKPTDPNGTRIRVGFTPGGGVEFINVGLRQMVATAGDIGCGKDCDLRIVLAPGLATAKWIDQQHFDVSAKGPVAGEIQLPFAEMKPGDRPAFQSRIRLRLQTLLADRFQLVAHKESREMPAYNLVVARNGTKLRPSSRTGDNGTMGGSKGELVSENIGIDPLAVNLTSMLGRPVLDRTGLTGRYDYRLKYAPEEISVDAKAETADSAPSIFTALQEQLGLRLEPTRTPVDVIVIDRAELPSAN